jgi:hypothetical protein
MHRQDGRQVGKHLGIDQRQHGFGGWRKCLLDVQMGFAELGSTS